MNFIYRIFIKGLLSLLPIVITSYLLVWVIQTAESAIGVPLKSYLPSWMNFPGAGVLLIVLLIFIFGLLVDNYLTQKFIDWFERRLQATPIIRSIYGPVRDFTQLFAQKGEGDAQRVVFVNFPALGGIEVLGLLTRDNFSELPPGMVPDDHVIVFIPLSYQMGGQSVLVNKSQIREAGIPTEKALQLALTAWIKTSK